MLRMTNLDRFSDCYQTMLGSKKKKMTLSHIAGEDEFSINRNFLSGEEVFVQQFQIMLILPDAFR